ncbi:MAG: hypothetical protein KCHDKBKB_01406 [Elusimicrobia bacterium]|nr:hypothetical protein [Elusimicrobiota bacterium]
MTAYRALLLYEDLLRGFQNHLTSSQLDVEAAFESGFGYLCSRLKLEQASLFWWDPQRRCLSMQYALRAGALMEGEEEIIIDESSPLRFLIEERKPVVVSEKKPWAAFIPLHVGVDFMGAIRIERSHKLPQGKVLSPLPPLHSEKRGIQRKYPLLEDIADLFSIRFFQLTRDEKHKKRTQVLQAGSEVATAVFERPRLRDMLESVSRSIVRHLGFDRVRFFLLGAEGNKLEGILGLQIPDMLIDLNGEFYPLKPGVNSLVDMILTSKGQAHVHLVGGRVVYVPLIVNSQVIGCLVADNLLSQQLIDEEQMEALRTLTGQIGMAVLNARLFEDVEQQAITDGLTKLYVHRYFQQRLKEEIDRADRYSYNVAVIMMDVDHFKRLNDSMGHLTGDKALEYLSQVIRGNIRRIDLAARYGGDEVVLVLPEITEEEAWLMGERLLNAIKGGPVQSQSGHSVKISVTMGAALYPSDAKNSRDLIEAADKALLWAKKKERGSICFYRTIAPAPVEKTA